MIAPGFSAGHQCGHQKMSRRNFASDARRKGPYFRELGRIVWHGGSISGQARAPDLKPIRDKERVPDYIWDKIQPALQKIVESAALDRSNVRADMYGWTTDVIPLRCYASFMILGNESPQENVVVSVQCFGDGILNCVSDIWTPDGGDVTVGPQEILSKNLSDTQFWNKLDDWITATRKYLLASIGDVTNLIKEHASRQSPHTS